MMMISSAGMVEFLITSLLLSISLSTLSYGQVLKFDDCTEAIYYSGLPEDGSNWTREELQSLIYRTHRNQVEFTNNVDPGFEDVWGALMDVDEASEPGTVSLIYSADDEFLPFIPFGERTWVRVHLFPVLRGVGLDGPDATDIHAIRPATTLSSIVVDDKYFGVCEVLTPPDTCVAPAEGAGPDTCACQRIFEPPASKKGDIARALMYMDLRYDGNEANTLDLRLTDCPFQAERDMAYLSQMLTWHQEDPPDDAERIRNFKTCANWQGNRNPFIDFPELADALFPPPSPLPEIGQEQLIYDKCQAIPTLPPTADANECDSVPEGDIVPFLVNSGGTSEDDKKSELLSLGLYSFGPMTAGFELFLTDNPWNGETFLEQANITTDGTLKFVAPEGFSGGNLFGIGLGDATSRSYEEQFETVQGNLTLSQDGEALWLYCMSASGLARPITIFNSGGKLVDPFLESYAEEESALPEGFPEEGIINLQHFDNLLYTGPRDDAVTTIEELKVAVRDPSNWKGSNNERFQLSRSGSSSSSGKVTVGTSMIMMTVMVIFLVASIM